ncbi:MAG: glycosyltransferase family 1 protein [Verrucomicrobiota bacterium]
MKLAVSVGELIPEKGGAFTFKEGVLRSLVKQASNRGYEIIVLTSTPDTVSALDLEGTIHVCDERINGHSSSQPQESPPFAKRVIKRSLRKLTRILPVQVSEPHEHTILPHRDKAAALTEKLVSEGAAVVLSLDAFNAHAFSIPHFVVVWDLQHRFQPFFPEVSSNGVWEYRERHFQRLLGRAAHVITGNDEARKEVNLFYNVPTERIHTIPMPVPDTSQWGSASGDNAILTKFGLKSPFLFYPAQFWPHKNHVTLLKAFAIALEELDSPIDLVFVGSDKGNLDHVQDVVRELSLEQRIHILGFVEREELGALYRNALSLAFVTFFGPDNIPPLEAFSLGCPVIASDVAGSEEQMGDAAIRVNPVSQKSIAEAIQSIVQSEEVRDRLIEKGYERISNSSMDHYANSTYDLMDEFRGIRENWSATQPFNLKT